MQRTKRIIGWVACLSLVLCLVTAVLWIRSYFRWDALVRTDSDSLSSLQACRGTVGLTFVRGQLNQRNAGWEARSDIDNPWGDPWWILQKLASTKFAFLGGGFAVYPRTGIGKAPSYRYLVVLIPYWLCFVVTAALPAKQLLRRMRQSRRRRKGYCVNCGYNLRATPDRCPECGTITVSAK